MLSLYHADESADDSVDVKVNNRFNIMTTGVPEHLVDCCPLLQPVQVQQIHSYLSKGKVWQAMGGEKSQWDAYITKHHDALSLRAKIRELEEKKCKE